MIEGALVFARGIVGSAGSSVSIAAVVRRLRNADERVIGTGATR
jgi:hypothetical protein